MTVTDVERGLIARYAARILARTEMPTRALRQIVWWLYERQDTMGFVIPQPIVEAFGQQYNQGYRFADFEAAFAKTREELIGTLDQAALESGRPEPLASNVETLVLALNVANPDAAWKIDGLVACCSRYDQVQYFANTVLEAASPIARAIAMLVGEPQRVVEECLAANSDLMGAGLLQIRDGEQIGGYNARYAVPLRIGGSLDRTYASFSEMRARRSGVSRAFRSDGISCWCVLRRAPRCSTSLSTTSANSGRGSRIRWREPRCWPCWSVASPR